MKSSHWPAFQKLRDLLKETAPEPEQMLSRLLTIERDIILPIKAVVVGLLLYSGLFFPHLFVDVTTPRSVARRDTGKVYFDHLQNGKGKTISAPYVLRAHAGAPVATPLEWREVRAGLTPGQFHIRNAMERFARVGDLFEGVRTRLQRIETAMERLPGLVPGAK